jgi:hypothetical protein
LSNPEQNHRPGPDHSFDRSEDQQLKLNENKGKGGWVTNCHGSIQVR